MDARCFDHLVTILRLLNHNLGCSSAVYLDFCCGITGLASAFHPVAPALVKYIKRSETIQGPGCNQDAATYR